MKSYAIEYHVEDFLRKEFQESSKNFSDFQDHTPTSKSIQGSSTLFFSINGSFLGIPTDSVITVEREMKIEKIPFIKNPHCLGFISLWGQAIPVLNIRAILGFTSDQKTEADRKRVIFFGSGATKTAIIVDSVEGVSSTEIGEFEKFTNVRASTAKGYYQGKLSSILLVSELTSLLEERIA